MEITVLWSDSAISELQAIHDYYLTTASLKVAHKLVNSIVDKSLLLSDNPRMGQVEELLKHRKDEIRYLVEGNYKIVYKIEGQIVLVASVFDCRQDPKKLAKKSNKMVLTPGQALDPGSWASPGEYNPGIPNRGVYPVFTGLSGSVRLEFFTTFHL